MGVETIDQNGRLLAIVLRSSHDAEGIQFFTPPEFSQQLGYMKRPAGYRIQPHIHLQVERKTTFTQEVLFVKRGRVHVRFYDDSERFVAETFIATGDAILLSEGGHGFEMLEETELIEVKQGPYLDDKRRFDPQ
ncbi:MAG: hypothetical protein ACO4AZ_06700 [Ilumatobacteraceae bacterium]